MKLYYSLIIRLAKYGLFTILMVFVSGYIASAKVTVAIATGYLSLVENNRIQNNKQNPYSPDSLLAYAAPYTEFITPRYTCLKTKEITGDTIRKSSDRNLDLLYTNGLTNLKSKGGNNFLTRNFFSLIVRDNHPSKGQMGVSSTRYFAPFAGKEIGNIRILQLNVFGPTLLDTLRAASGWFEKSGNAMHMKTVERKLRNQLLFNPGECINPQLMAENEKFIRDLPYIQDVAITLSNQKADEGSVDVVVIIKERFEYGISGNVNTNSTDWEISNQNMFGLGHQFSALLNYNPTEQNRWGGGFKYQISDLDRKFISTGIGYTNDYRKKGWNSFIEKRFIASKEDWAGGVAIERALSDHYLTPYSYTRLDSAVSYLNSDIWYGERLKNNISYSSLGNIIIAGRYFHQNYFHNQGNQFANSLFRNHDFVMGAIGISKRDLFKNNQIYGYGITEDIPYGRYAEMAAGVDMESNRSRPYFHFNYSKANILPGGAYFKWQFGLGGYLSDSRLEQGALVIRSNYFSNFVYLNRHPYRFFVNMELLSGINRFQEEYLMANNRFGVRDYFSLKTMGTNRFKINIESVRFWGWEKSGFRFAHYFFADAACLSDNISKIMNDKFIGGIGAGIRIHNESLVFNVLEIRLSWIPIAPHNSTPTIFNVFGQPKARFDDLLGGKPQEIPYQ